MLITHFHAVRIRYEIQEVFFFKINLHLLCDCLTKLKRKTLRLWCDHHPKDLTYESSSPHVALAIPAPLFSTQ